MPRPKTDRLWVDRIRSMIEDDPKLSSLRILRLLEQEAGGRFEYQGPSDKTIRRIKREYLDLPEEERRRYGRFCWPESMENGSLPWEAARAALDLMRHWGPPNRPPIRLVRWFWRVSQAAPDAPFGSRLNLARQLAIWEVQGERETGYLEGIEWYLAFTAWRCEEDAKAYRQVTERLGLPNTAGEIPSLGVRRGGPPADRKTALAMVEYLVGPVPPGVALLLADDMIESATPKPDREQGQEEVPSG